MTITTFTCSSGGIPPLLVHSRKRFERTYLDFTQSRLYRTNRPLTYLLLFKFVWFINFTVIEIPLGHNKWSPTSTFFFSSTQSKVFLWSQCGEKPDHPEKNHLSEFEPTYHLTGRDRTGTALVRDQCRYSLNKTDFNFRFKLFPGVWLYNVSFYIHEWLPAKSTGMFFDIVVTFCTGE